ncbi:MAG: hypothetical protein RL715_226, partial [Chloroflexota bacterium]
MTAKKPAPAAKSVAKPAAKTVGTAKTVATAKTATKPVA